MRCTEGGGSEPASWTGDRRPRADAKSHERGVGGEKIPSKPTPPLRPERGRGAANFRFSFKLQNGVSARRMVVRAPGVDPAPAASAAWAVRR